MSEYNLFVIHWAKSSCKTSGSKLPIGVRGHAMDVPMDQCSRGMS